MQSKIYVAIFYPRLNLFLVLKFIISMEVIINLETTFNIYLFDKQLCCEEHHAD